MSGIQKKAVVLLSGGLDSATALACARADGFQCYALSFDYGQRHKAELQASERVARTLGAEQHKILNLDLGVLGGSALTDLSIDVPDHASEGIPVTYVPARNTVFLSFALAWAEILGADDIYIGVNAVDYSGYPDCRPEYIKAYESMANLATKVGVEGHKMHIHTPLIDLTKADIIRLGMEKGVDYSQTVSCYAADTQGRACGVCDSCRLRARGFADAGVKDPTSYQK